MNVELDLLSHTALKGSAVLLAALVAGLVFRRLAASRRYAIWMTAMLALAVLPFAMVSLPAWRVIPKSSPPPDWMVLEPKEVVEAVEMPVKASAVAEPVMQAMPVTTAMPPPEPVRALWTWDAVIERLPMLWLGVAALMLVRLAWSALSLGRLKQRLKRCECDEVASVARELGLKHVPRLFVGAADAVPMVWGVWKPCLLLPCGFESWSSEKRRGVLLHELAHLRRRDPLALWLAQTVKALHWFNPLAWLTLRQMRADQERACDDAVLRHGVRASDYAQALLDLSRHNRVAPGLALCALTITRCAPVESRVRAVLDAKCCRDALTLRWLAGMTALAMLLMLPVAMLHAIEGPKLRGRILDRHGVVLAETTKEKVRHYPLKALAAHVIGYTGKTRHDDPTPMGRSEIEKAQNEPLLSGMDVKLTLDARIQSIAHRAMLDAGFKRGATVVLDPRTGEVLAMVSLPSFDLNLFIPSISIETYQTIIKDADMPLIARAFRAEYPPGASFSGLTALAGIRAGKGDSVFECSGSVTYGGRAFHCWKTTGHGRMSLGQAIENNCNCYRYQLGNAAGHSQLESLADNLGLGKPYDLPLEKVGEGYFPKKASSEKSGRVWTAGDVANMSIGQGMVLATPLQTAVLAATLANGGRVPAPVLLGHDEAPRWRADLAADGLSKAHMDQVRQAMRRVVDGGRGKEARSEKFVIAATTGTVLWKISKNQNLNVMMGFAPFDAPELAFAIIHEGEPGEVTSAGAKCGPVVKRIVEESLALPADGSGEVKEVEDSHSWQSAFKEQATKIRQAINQAAAAMGESQIQVSSVVVSSGELEVKGIASGMIAALAFRERMAEIGRPWHLEWTFPVPVTMSDGQRVRFSAKGLTPAAVEAEKERKKRQDGFWLSDPVAVLERGRRLLWDIAQKNMALPDLPDEARLLTGTRDMKFPREMKGTRAGFAAPRDVVLEWLQEALQHTSNQATAWPEKPAAFTHSYHRGESDLVVTTKDGETVEIHVQAVRPRPEPKFKLSPKMPSLPNWEEASHGPRGSIQPEDAWRLQDGREQFKVPNTTRRQLPVLDSPWLGKPVLDPVPPRAKDELDVLVDKYRAIDRSLITR
jgi:beta-lactamase regulating signal transducer with metallopeptidase domain